MAWQCAALNRWPQPPAPSAPDLGILGCQRCRGSHLVQPRRCLRLVQGRA